MVHCSAILGKTRSEG